MHFPSASNRLAAIALAVGATLATSPARADLQAGDSAPDFTLQASQAGKAFTFALRDALRKGPVVVYFYPSAFTQGCNIQAHTFAEQSDQFQAAGATIVGVSLDSIQRLNDFSADPQYCAGKIPVASDVQGKVARAFDLSLSDIPSGRKDTRGVDIDHARTDRTTFVLTPDGKVAATIGGLSPIANVAKALDVVQALKAKAGRLVRSPT